MSESKPKSCRLNRKLDISAAQLYIMNSQVVFLSVLKVFNSIIKLAETLLRYVRSEARKLVSSDTLRGINMLLHGENSYDPRSNIPIYSFKIASISSHKSSHSAAFDS